MDPFKARHFVGPDLGPNCLQRLSADNIRRVSQQRQPFPQFNFILFAMRIIMQGNLVNSEI